MLQNYFGDPINSQGDALVLSNTGQACGDALTNILSSGGISFDTSSALHNWTYGCLIQNVSNAPQYVGWNSLNDSQASWLESFTTESTVPSVAIVRAQSRSTSGKSLTFAENTSGKPILQDAGGNTVWTGGTALARSTAYRFEVVQSIGSSATVKCDYYALGSTSPVATGFSSTTCNTGTANLSEMRYGLASGTTYSGNARIGRVAYNSGGTNYIGTYATPAPWITAGSDLIVAHGRTGTFNGRLVASPGTTVTLSWAGSTNAPALASGSTSVAPTTAKVVATAINPGATPADTTYTYTITASSSDSQTSTATMNVTVAHSTLMRLDSSTNKFISCSIQFL